MPLLQQKNGREDNRISSAERGLNEQAEGELLGVLRIYKGAFCYLTLYNLKAT